MSEIIHTKQGEGKKLSIAGSLYSILLGGSQTKNQLAIIEMNVAAGAGPVPHEHPAFSESFYVLEGPVEMITKEKSFVASKGDLVTIPFDGPVHCFKNPTSEPAKLLCIVAPAGLDSFFEEATNIVKPGAAPTDEDKQKLKDLAVKYDQKLYPPDYFEKV